VPLWLFLMTHAPSTLLDRFLRYVRLDTQADDRSATYPSTPGQLVLGAMLRDELLALGLADAAQDEHGVVIATVPGNVPGAPSIPHGPVKVVFTCDEEIGKGVLYLEPAMIGAAVAYTLDGMGTAEIEDETFSADAATVTITGVNIHPSIAKGRMINALRLAGM